MKKILWSGLAASIALLIFGIGMLYLHILLFPDLALNYFDQSFRSDAESQFLFYSHAFILGFALAFFWNRIKSRLTGGFLLKGIEFGLVYGLVATLPSMWIIYTFIDVKLDLVLTWFLFGVVEAAIAGLVFEVTNP